MTLRSWPTSEWTPNTSSAISAPLPYEFACRDEISVGMLLVPRGNTDDRAPTQPRRIRAENVGISESRSQFRRGEGAGRGSMVGAMTDADAADTSLPPADARPRLPETLPPPPA